MPPVAPAGMIAAFASTSPCAEFNVDTVGCGKPDGHAVKKERDRGDALCDRDALPAASTAGEYVAMIVGNHNAFLNVEIRPAVIPSFYYGVGLFGDHNLLYRSYLHDFGSPDAVQNPGGNGGWILEVAGAGAVNNVIWSNHLTRGGARRELLYGRVQLQSLAEQCYGWRLGPGLGSCFCGRRGV